MTNVCTDPWANFGTIDLDFNTDENDRPTWPPPGTASLVVEDKYEPLFTSATWTVQARVGAEIISQSTEARKAHSDAFLKRWARQMIRTKYERLRQLGVDADGEYVKWGGLLEDLKP